MFFVAMTNRLYYQDSFLYDFDAEVHQVLDNPRPAIVLHRTAFYPTSGGQVFDTGSITIDNRSVNVRFVTREEAAKLGLRKLPPTERDELRLIDIRDFDLTACGGTHVSQTGQIASILLRKVEKVRQGWRVEFVAGQRAVTTARRDYSTLTDTAALFSSHVYDVPQQARKS